jgi:hypothetical protein
MSEWPTAEQTFSLDLGTAIQDALSKSGSHSGCGQPLVLVLAISPPVGQLVCLSHLKSTCFNNYSIDLELWGPAWLDSSESIKR